LTQSVLALIFLGMEFYRPLRAALFIYECVRLVVLLGVFSLLRPGGGVDFFPWLVYAAPNALFPLMTLFLWQSVSRWGAYAPLYAAGKCVALVSIVFFWFFSRQNIYTALYLSNPGAFWALGGVLFLLAGDMLSAAGGLALAGKVREREAARVPPPGLPVEAAGEQGGR
jgi:hypothetical protein